MQTHKLTIIPIAAMLMLTAIGCNKNENKRLAEMAEKHLQQQAEHNRRMAELQREVAEGSRRLVEADAKARQEMVALQRDVQAERSEVGQQRDSLEDERRDLAAKRRPAPIIAAVISNIGLLLACLLPLVLCWYLLHRRVELADDQAVAEVLLEDFVANGPLLRPPREEQRSIGFRDDGDARRLLDDSERAGASVRYKCSAGQTGVSRCTTTSWRPRQIIAAKLPRRSIAATDVGTCSPESEASRIIIMHLGRGRHRRGIRRL